VDPRPGSLSDLDAAAEERRELAAERQPEARALHAALQRARHLRELLEHHLEVLEGDADARVRHRERDRAAVRVEARGDLDRPAFRELERVRDEVAKDLRDLALVGVELAEPLRLLEDEVDGVGDEAAGRSIPRSALKSSPDVEFGGRTSTFPASIFARSRRSFTSSERSSARLRDELDLRSPARRVSGPSILAISIPQSARTELSGVRNSWLMLDRNRLFISSARRRCAAFSSSSA
jgi:hypothetical protein